MTASPMIKVMSFNIRYSLADDGENHWDHRRDLVIARIHAFEPDLLGLQECRDDTQADFIKNNLPAYHFHGVRREGGGETALEMAPALFLKSAFQIIQQEHFWLSETPQVAGSKSWGSVFARTATWVRLVHKPTGRTIIFVNTHFDYQSTAIIRAAQLLRKWLDQAQKESPVILTGDFNADKNSAAYQLLAGDGKLFDAYRQVHPISDNETTFHGFGKPEEMTPIDWILVSNHFRVADAKVDRLREGNRFPSDHYPVTVVLNWKD
jgi:endonuclease/exonuclease/phosphatase family metal-dependent hydrolase